MSDFTFLTEEQCYGNDKLDILKKRGATATMTDFSILLGGWIPIDTSYWPRDCTFPFDENPGVYWLKTECYSDVGVAYENDGVMSDYAMKRENGARPALSFSSISDIPTNGESGKRAKDGILEVKYGYYPQKVASKDMQERLERDFKRGSLLKTGKKYTTDSRKYNDYDEVFSPKQHEEFQLDGKRYVRVEANSCFDGAGFILSNEKMYRDGDPVWVEVSPVKWLVDENAKIMITDKLIFSGVQFKNGSTREYHTEEFESTAIKMFMDEYFSRDLEQSREAITLGEQTEETEETQETQEFKPRKSRLQKLNPDKTKTADRSRMTDTEIIQNWIEAGESVLLRGPSGIGKTERIKTLYPDLIYMKLTNNMFPEKVVGSVNLQTGQSIPPDFAKTAIMQGATEEERKIVEENIQNIYTVADKVYERSKGSDKKIVILLDELLNVKPAVQALVYTLVLNRMVEIGKGLKLPDNVVIVATGNQKKYSSVAEDLAEPLEKRFDHILDMEPKVGEWITEYAIPNKIHPAVIGYILTKYNNSGKSEAIQNMGYFYEEPDVGEEHLDKNGCKGRTNDPRGWASISNTLYNFERNLEAGKYAGKDVEDIMKRSISSKLREEWSAEFFDFYNLPTLTPEEVTKGLGEGYTQADLPRDISERFAYMTALITADETQVESCREFIRKHCDPEYLSIYDIYWAGNDERRMEKIAELQEQELSLHTGKEAEEYAEDGIGAYTNIGQMYSSHLTRDSKEEVRSEENERS